MSQFTTVARVGEIPEGGGRSFGVDGRTVAVFLVAGEYFALEDSCPHMGAPLSLGDIEDETVICDRHLWAFRLRDGTCTESEKLKAESFAVRVEGDEIQVCVPETSD